MAVAATSIALPLLIFLSCLAIFTTAVPSSYSSSSTTFVKTKCSSTTFPSVCFQSLSSYASAIKRDPRKLTQTALTVTLSRAQSTKTFLTTVTKMKGLTKRDLAVVKVCVEEVGDTVDRLKMSLDELKLIKGVKDKDFLWHISNMETWMSAALTDENTCVDGFDSRVNRRIKNSIKSRIVSIAQVTSNALALVNQYAGK